MGTKEIKGEGPYLNRTPLILKTFILNETTS